MEIDAMKRISAMLFALTTLLLPLPATASIYPPPAPVSVELRLIEPNPRPGLVKVVDPDNGEAIYLHKTAIINTAQIINAKVIIDILDDFQVEITLNPEAAKKLHTFTKANITRRLATLVDGKVVDVASIREPITSGICQFRAATRQEADRIVQGIATPLPSRLGLPPEEIARAYFTALRDRGMPIVVEFMHEGELAKFKDVFIALMEKEAAKGKREFVSGLFGEQATLAEVKALSPKEVKSSFMQNASLMISNMGFTFEKLEVLGFVPEGDMAHVVARIEVGLWPAAIKRMDVISMKRDGDEWKLMLTKEFDGLLLMIQSK